MQENFGLIFVFEKRPEKMIGPVQLPKSFSLALTHSFALAISDTVSSAISNIFFHNEICRHGLSDCHDLVCQRALHSCCFCRGPSECSSSASAPHSPRDQMSQGRASLRGGLAPAAELDGHTSQPRSSKSRRKICQGLRLPSVPKLLHYSTLFLDN